MNILTPADQVLGVTRSVLFSRLRLKPYQAAVTDCTTTTAQIRVKVAAELLKRTVGNIFRSSQNQLPYACLFRYIADGSPQ